MELALPTHDLINAMKRARSLIEAFSPEGFDASLPTFWRFPNLPTLTVGSEPARFSCRAPIKYPATKFPRPPADPRGWSLLFKHGFPDQRSEVRNQRSEVRGQKSEVRGQRSEAMISQCPLASDL